MEYQIYKIYVPVHEQQVDSLSPLQEALAAAEVDSAAGVGVQFGEREGGGLFAAVDERGRLAETGWQAFPTLMCAVPGNLHRLLFPGLRDCASGLGAR